MANTFDVALCGRFFVVFPLVRLLDILVAGWTCGKRRKGPVDE